MTSDIDTIRELLIRHLNGCEYAEENERVSRLIALGRFIAKNENVFKEALSRAEHTVVSCGEADNCIGDSIEAALKYAEKEYLDAGLGGSANQMSKALTDLKALRDEKESYKKLERYVHEWLAKLAPETTNFESAFKDIEKGLALRDTITEKDSVIEGLSQVIESQKQTHDALLNKLNLCADIMEKFIGNDSYTNDEYDFLITEMASVYYTLRTEETANDQ